MRCHTLGVNDWKMEFNLNECKVLQMGKNRKNGDYRLHGSLYECDVTHKDLGVVMEADRTASPGATWH